MNEPDSQASLQHLSEKIDALVLGIKYLLLILIILASLLNFWMARSIGTFAQIFTHVLPGEPLPLISYWVVRCATPLTLVTLVLPLLAFFVLAKVEKPVVWVTISMVILFIIGLQFYLTWIGCFTPLLSGVVGNPTSSTN